MLYTSQMYNREYKPCHIRADDQNLYKVFLDNESFNDIFDIIRDL